jgi:hypothetical protein
MDNLKPYQLFKALYIHTWNTNGVKIKDPDRLSNKELNYKHN